LGRGHVREKPRVQELGEGKLSHLGLRGVVPKRRGKLNWAKKERAISMGRKVDRVPIGSVVSDVNVKRRFKKGDQF